MKKVIYLMFFVFALSTNVVFAENENDNKSELSLVKFTDNETNNKEKISKSEFNIFIGTTLMHSVSDFTESYKFDDIMKAITIGAKYKYKPFEKYDIRILGEIGVGYFVEPRDFAEVLPNINLLVGVNYEYKLNSDISIWGDLGFGFTINVFEEDLDYRGQVKNHIAGSFAISPEIGVKYKQYSLSINRLTINLPTWSLSDRANFNFLNLKLGYSF